MKIFVEIIFQRIQAIVSIQYANATHCDNIIKLFIGFTSQSILIMYAFIFSMDINLSWCLWLP